MYVVLVEGIAPRRFVRLQDAMKYGRSFRGSRRASWVDCHGWMPTAKTVRQTGALYCEEDSPVAIAAIRWEDSHDC